MSGMVGDEPRTGSGPDYWNSISVTWSQCRQTLWRSHSDAVNRALLTRWLPEVKADRVLKTDLFDEMCSDGLYPVLATHARSFVGMDISMATLRGAQSRHGTLQGIAADVLRLPFADESFDLIVSNSTLDHFESHAAIAESLVELFRVLRQGGQLIITLDNPENPVIALRNALPFRLLKRLGTPYYVGATLNERNLRLLLEESGFKTMEGTSIMHCPRVIAVAFAHLLQRFSPSWMQQGFLGILMAFERLASLPTYRLTGHFVAMRATKEGLPG